MKKTQEIWYIDVNLHRWSFKVNRFDDIEIEMGGNRELVLKLAKLRVT